MAKLWVMVVRLNLVWVLAFILGCTNYHLGSSKRSLPGGYDRVTIPVFANKTLETGIEPIFTSALIEELERQKLAKVVEREESQVVLEGEITNVNFVKGSKAAPAGIPTGAELVQEYRILIKADLRLVRRSDGKLLWSGTFDGERRYPAPQIALSKLNSADALYNQSARMQNIKILAQDMMVQAHSNMTENF